MCIEPSFIFYQVSFTRTSLNHDDVFILDTDAKIFQFNGSNSSIQERAKALEVVQYIQDTYHDGKCEVAAVGKLNLVGDPPRKFPFKKYWCCQLYYLTGRGWKVDG